MFREIWQFINFFLYNNNKILGTILENFHNKNNLYTY